MKALIISDTHNKHLSIKGDLINNKDNDIDMIIHCGDVSGRGYRNEIIPFLSWFNGLNFKYKVMIAGNHDFYFETATTDEIKTLLSEYPNITYLNDSGIEIEGYKIWGSPVQPWFYNWAFNRKDDEINKHWDLIPLDTQILLTHGPIKGYLDLTKHGDSAGCPRLREKIGELKELKMHCSGHIHEGYGKYVTDNGVTLVNASIVDYYYEPVNEPILVEL